MSACTYCNGWGQRSGLGCPECRRRWPLLALIAKFVDTRRFWRRIKPADWVGGLVYCVETGNIALVTSQGCADYRPAWKDQYLYLAEWDQKMEMVREGGQFVRKLIPLAPPHATHWLTAQWAASTQDHHDKIWLARHNSAPPAPADAEEHRDG